MVVAAAVRIPVELRIRVRQLRRVHLPPLVLPDEDLGIERQVVPEPLHVEAVRVLPARDADAAVAGLVAQLRLVVRVDLRLAVRADVVQHLVQQRAAVDADGEASDGARAGLEVADAADRDELARRGLVVGLALGVLAGGHVQRRDDSAAFKDVELLAQLVNEQRVLVAGRHLLQPARLDVALHLAGRDGLHVAVVRLRAVVGVGLNERIAVHILLQHMHALALPVQLARAVLLVRARADARLVGDVDVLRLLALKHRDRLHHQIPDGLLVLRVGQVVVVRVHVPEARRLRHAAHVRRSRLVPACRLLGVKQAQVEHVFAARSLAFKDVQRKDAAFALLAPGVFQLHLHHVVARRRGAAIREQAVPGYAPAAGLHAHRPHVADGLAGAAAEQPHRQRAALPGVKVEAPAVLPAHQRHVVGIDAAEHRRGKGQRGQKAQRQQKHAHAFFHDRLQLNECQIPIRNENA